MELIQDFLADPGLFIAHYSFTLTLGLLFLAVVLGVVGGTMFVSDRNPAGERLAPAQGQNVPRSKAPSIRFTDEPTWWMRLTRPAVEPFMPKDEERISVLRLKMMHAGYMNPSAPRTFFASRILISMVFGAGVLFGGPILFPHYEVNLLLLAAGISLGIGYMIPTWFLEKKTATRRRLIEEGFPDALDMLLVCVEAGLGLDAALARVGSEFNRAHPVLAQEFRLVGNELRAGRSRQDALRNLAERTGVQDVRTLVTLLVQSDELGASIAQALRVHAFEMRSTRILRAEERAHKIPVKMAFPLMFGLIPVVMMVALTPAVLKIVEFVLPILAKNPMPGA